MDSYLPNINYESIRLAQLTEIAQAMGVPLYVIANAEKGPVSHEIIELSDCTDLVLAVCEGCGRMGDVQIEPCRTSYDNDKLNTVAVLCRDCASQYHDYWNEMWDDYYRGRL